MASENANTSHEPKSSLVLLLAEEQWQDVSLPVRLDGKWDTWGHIETSNKLKMILECKDKKNCD